MYWEAVLSCDDFIREGVIELRKKIILDTDIGSDLDDSVCLAYLLSHPNCELLGITTVSGEPVKRAMLASAICKVAKKNIPIYPGAEKPLLAKQRQPFATQAKALVNWDHDKEFPQCQAISFLRNTIRQHPGEITLLAIGPLTNIALLFTIDSEIPKLLKELVLMCGIFTNQLAGVGPVEWNAICDPHATAIVYKAPVKIFRSIGLDVTWQVTMDKDEIIKNFKADVLKPVLSFAGVGFENRDKITFHDPLAAAVIFEDSICEFETGKVDVELTSDRLQGLTYWIPDNVNGIHKVALKVDKDKFFKHYFSVVNNIDEFNG